MKNDLENTTDGYIKSLEIMNRALEVLKIIFRLLLITH